MYSHAMYTYVCILRSPLPSVYFQYLYVYLHSHLHFYGCLCLCLRSSLYVCYILVHPIFIYFPLSSFFLYLPALIVVIVIIITIVIVS